MFGTETTIPSTGTDTASAVKAGVVVPSFVSERCTDIFSAIWANVVVLFPSPKHLVATSFVKKVFNEPLFTSPENFKCGVLVIETFSSGELELPDEPLGGLPVEPLGGLAVEPLGGLAVEPLGGLAVEPLGGLAQFIEILKPLTLAPTHNPFCHNCCSFRAAVE